MQEKAALPVTGKTPTTDADGKQMNKEGAELNASVAAGKERASRKDPFGADAEYRRKAADAKAGKWPGGGFDSVHGSKRTTE